MQTSSNEAIRVVIYNVLVLRHEKKSLEGPQVLYRLLLGRSIRNLEEPVEETLNKVVKLMGGYFGGKNVLKF